MSDTENSRRSRRTVGVRSSAKVIPFDRNATESEDDPQIEELKKFHSKQLADPFEGLYASSGADGHTTIAPTYNPASLLRLPNENSILRQCIDAYCVNIESFGYRLEYVGEEEQKESAEAKAEWERITSLMDQPNDEYSMTELRQRVRRDVETFGYGFIEVGRDNLGEIVMLYHAVAHKTRMVHKDRNTTPVKRQVLRNGKMVEQTINKRFRRYVQRIGNKVVYFKELGDPRPISPDTGQVDNSLAIEDQATELYHLSLYSPGDSYGLPRWINQLPNVLGTRESEMTNLQFFKDNAVPALAVLVSGGMLTDGAVENIENHFTHVRGRDSMNRVLVLEATGDEEAASEKGQVPAPRVDIKPLSDARQKDGMFQEYETKTQTKIRSSFRLPPLFIGTTEDMTYACYDEATETLTDHGWVTLDQWEPGMRVATFNVDTGYMEFQAPEGDAPQVYDFEGDLHTLVNAHTDLAVTPNHRMLFKSGSEWVVEPIEDMINRDNKKYHFRDGYEFEGGSRLVDFSVPWEQLGGGPSAPYDLPALPIPGDLFLEFLGYYVSEGSTCGNKTRNSHVVLGQMPGDKGVKGNVLANMERVLSELEELRYPITWNYPQSPAHKPDMVYHTLRYKGLRNWLREETGTHSHNKRLPSWFRQLPKDQMQILFDALMLGDGTYDKREGRTACTYYTNSNELAGQIQEMAYVLGYRARVQPGTRCLRVEMRKANESKWVSADDIGKQYYKGRVYCFTVPNGLFVVRRNGKVSVQGNTASSSLIVAESQVFGPERSKIDDLLNNELLAFDGQAPQYWRVRSNPPRVTQPENVVDAIGALDDVGAMSPNTAIGLANEMFDLNIPSIEEAWGSYPISFSTTVLARNQLAGVKDLYAEAGDNLPEGATQEEIDAELERRRKVSQVRKRTRKGKANAVS